MHFGRITDNSNKRYKLSSFQVILLILSAFSFNSCWVQASETLVFATPKALLDIKVENQQDVIELMHSLALYNQLLSIAKQIDSNVQVKFKRDQKIALSSMLEQHQETIKLVDKQADPLSFFHYSQYALAKINAENTQEVEEKLKQQLKSTMSILSDEALYKASYSLGWSLSLGQDYMLYLFNEYQKNHSLTETQALNLLANYQIYKVYEQIIPIASTLLPIEQSKRYVIQSDVLIKTPEGVTLSAVVVRKRGDTKKRPAAFQFSIYADEAWHIKNAIHAAAHGYIGVIANTRGKRLSTDKIVPWEHDGKDANAVIDWISKQPWNDGRVAMYGGSYLGFTQWAAAKYMHPALKTMVPYAAANPITGLPIENNIFMTPNYQWAFHVTNNKTMDHSVYADWQHWRDVYTTLFESGRAFKDIDKIEGTPNPWFQKWLQHPDFDEYYQAMLPYQKDYEKINIPVLSITGYFDGGQISAIDFLSRHYLHNKNANHSLLIGPYNHRSAQGIPNSHHSNYQLDPVALEKDTEEITFQWFDHVLYNQAKPDLVKDKVNYQLMGSNTWQHRSSYLKMNQQNIPYYLGNKKDQAGYYRLIPSIKNADEYISQIVNLTDRKTQFNFNFWPVIQKELKPQNGLVFTTEPFTKTQQLAGAITGYFSLSINKKDVDIGFTFYEINNKGDVFHLTRYMSRASYAHDMGQRQLLTPNKKTIVPIVNGRMTAKLIEKGSRLVIVLNVNKNENAQVNMGSGKDVSEETIADAGEPLEIKWFSDSKINIPVKPWKG